MTIITRQTSGIGVSAKNSPLTHSELDQNLIDLVQGKLVALNVSSNVVLSPVPGVLTGTTLRPSPAATSGRVSSVTT